MTEEGLPMSRAAAISHLLFLSRWVDTQFGNGPVESDALEAETRAALKLLGATDEEIDADDADD